MNSAVTVSVFAVVGGLVAGSFANVAIARWPHGATLMNPRRSQCPSCATQLAARDNIPVVSWLVLRGRCRTCEGRISVRYPVVELSTALLFVGTVGRWGIDLLVPTLLVLMWALVVATAIDLEHQIIPNRLTFPLPLVLLVGLAAAAIGAGAPRALLRGALFAVVVPLIMFAISELFARVRGQRGIGMGDVKLAVSLALVLGYLGGMYVVVFAYVAIFSAVIIAFTLILARRASLASRIPFGPYLACGAATAVLGGEPVVAVARRLLGM